MKDADHIDLDGLGAGDSAHQFRIFKRDGERRAFRLERAFWQVLERAAKEQGKRIGDLVFEVIQAHPDAQNLSSELRCHALAWLDERARIEDSKFAAAAALAVFNAAPSAGIILDEERRIVAYNRAMLAFLQQHHDKTLAEIKEARFTFDLPVPQILEIAGGGGGKMVECGFRFVVNGNPTSGRTRVSIMTTVPGAPRQLLAFII